MVVPLAAELIAVHQLPGSLWIIETGEDRAEAVKLVSIGMQPQAGYTLSAGRLTITSSSRHERHLCRYGWNPTPAGARRVSAFSVVKRSRCANGSQVEPSMSAIGAPVASDVASTVTRWAWSASRLIRVM